MNHIKMFEHKHDWEKKVGEWLDEDLSNIAQLCEDQGIALILQNYPVSYALANGELQKVARERGLPLVDNLASFQPIPPEERSGYLFDDDHCTFAGHRIMAENVYKPLASEGVIHR